MRHHSSERDPGRRDSTLMNIIIGFALYPLGDLIAQLIMGHVSLPRLIALSLTGGLIYRAEVVAWFGFLDRMTISAEAAARYPIIKPLLRADTTPLSLGWLGRTLGAWLYFNPLWIARHVFIIMLAVGDWSTFHLMPALAAAAVIGCKSFVANLPLSIAGNYLIQERLPLKWRFLASATMSGILAVVYALEFVFFS